MCIEITPILIDFGSAILREGENKKDIFLTPGFSPLELYSEKSNQDRHSDIYSLSAILYYYLSGETPIEASKRIHEDNLISLKEMKSGVSKNLDRIIMKNLSLNIKKRSKYIKGFKLKLWREYALIKWKRRTGKISKFF